MPVMQTNAVAMAYGAAFTAIVAVARGQSFGFDWSPAYVGSLLYLALFGSIVAFGCYLTLLGRIGADRAAYANILHPVVALGVSTALEGFGWSWPALLGLVFVVAGNFFVLSRARAVRAARATGAR